MALRNLSESEAEPAGGHPMPPEQSSKARLYIDLALGTAIAVVVFVAAVQVELFEWFYEFSRAHEDMELDEVVPAILALGIGSTFFAFRRLVDQHAEIKRRIAAEQHVARIAMHDPLTGLPNRRLFGDRLDKAVARARRSDEQVAVLMIDLDRFKPVNDIHGHAAGDQLLIQIAERLQATLRDQDTLARMGGDEFAVVQVALETPDSALRVARRLIAAIEAPFKVDGASVSVGLSIGICIFAGKDEAPDELIRRADIALLRAKQLRGSTFSFYEAEMDAHIARRATLERELREGLEDGQIGVAYQPIIDLETEKTIGVEALARWSHPLRGQVSPVEFIPVAEDSNLIAAVCETVLRQACRDAADWPPELMISLNVSPVQFRNGGLAQQILSILEEEGLPPERLEVELTENALIDDPLIATGILNTLKDHGVHTALDDFGTGYSSLAHLRDLAFDRIKIDRSFVSCLAEDPNSAAIVRAVLALGQSLGVPTTAEGIEEPVHLSALREQGCQFGQGFL